VVTQKDFDKAYKIVVKKTDKDYKFYEWEIDDLNNYNFENLIIEN